MTSELNKVFSNWTCSKETEKSNRTSMIYNNVLKYLIFISLVSQKSDLLTKTHKYVSETKLLFI